MITGDYIERKRVTKSGKTVMDKIVTTTDGTEYAIGPRLGEGGVAAVYRCRRCSDKKEFAFKEYVPDPKMRKIHYLIKKNLKTLIADPIKESSGAPLKSFVRPLELVELKASRGFGYVMELVDTKRYLNYGVKLRKNYPDANILCELGKNMAHLFEILHLGRGWCYKDINEGNIYLNVRTGEILIIDCDNISVPKDKTILGTPGYIAPEVFITEKPDTRTDDHSLAVFLFRLLVWGWPLDGKRTHKYLLDNNTDVFEAGPVIYGTEALFALDPKDTRNSIRGMGTDVSKMVEMMWDNLPEELQKCFIKTFGEGLRRREGRTTPTQWYSAFDKVQKNGLVTCPKCGKKCFGSLTNRRKKCIYCDATLPLLKKAATGTPPAPAPIKRTVKPLESVTFDAVRDVGPTLSVTAKRKAELPGKTLHPSLSTASIMKVQYNAEQHLLAVVNKSSYDWIVTDNGQKMTCRPGGRVILKKGMIITVLRRQLQLTVVSIQ